MTNTGISELSVTLGTPQQGNPAELEGKKGQKLAESLPPPPLLPPDTPKSLLPGAAVTTAAINGLIPLPLKTPSVSGDEGDGGGATIVQAESKDSNVAPQSSQPAVGEAAGTLGGACPSSILQPISLPLMNSLVSNNKVVVDQGLLKATAAPGLSGEKGNASGPSVSVIAPSSSSPIVPAGVATPPPPPTGAGAVSTVAAVANIASAAAMAQPNAHPQPVMLDPSASSAGAAEPTVPPPPTSACTVRPSASAIEAASLALGSSADDDAHMAPVVAAAAATQIAAGIAGQFDSFRYH